MADLCTSFLCSASEATLQPSDLSQSHFLNYIINLRLSLHICLSHLHKFLYMLKKGNTTLTPEFYTLVDIHNPQGCRVVKPYITHSLTPEFYIILYFSNDILLKIRMTILFPQVTQKLLTPRPTNVNV